MNRSAQLPLAMTRTGTNIAPMIPMRAIATALIALFTTAFWGVMIHFGALALGVPIAVPCLVAVLAGIFFLLVLVLSMAGVASDASGEDQQS